MFKKGDRVRRTAGDESGGMRIGDIATVAQVDGDKLFLREYRPDEGRTFYTGYFEVIEEAPEPKPVPNYWDIPNWVLAVVLIADIIVVFWKGVLI